MIYKIYMISNTDIFREGLNAVAAFCHSDGFRAATWIGLALGVIMTVMAYVKRRNIMVFLKWLVLYVFLFNILLGVPLTVGIMNASDQTASAQIVDDVPLGIALPAHIITALGYGFSSNLEKVFTLPNEEQYHKTGMLFGSNLLQLSLASQLGDPDVINDMNNYVKNCVVDDILIDHTYTFNQLLHSKDIWALMTGRPSATRGFFINKRFHTCLEAADMLTLKVNEYSSKIAPAILAKFIPAQKAYTPAAINTMLVNSYQYFNGGTKTSTDIFRQNIAINAFRAGIENYQVEAGSAARLKNIANTMPMNDIPMVWATSHDIGIRTLPLMQAVLLLLLLCVFPLVAVLSLIPGLGFSVFKNYIYSLMWLESWSLMYAILNMAINFYITKGGDGSVTLSNINLLAQAHSNIAGIAGYLALAIPFLSFGIVYIVNYAVKCLGAIAGTTINKGGSA